MSERVTSRPLVLVPGACLGGWAWGTVSRHLRAAGHEVHPVTLTGLGERVHLAHPGIDLATHITDVVNLLDYEDLHDVVLVGHSYAGPVIAGVASQRPQRLGALVYLDTGPLPDGVSISDVQSAEQRERQQRAVAERGDGWRWPLPDRATLERGLFGSVSGLTDAHFALIEARGTAQPMATFTSKQALASPSGEVAMPRRVAILCSAGGMSLAELRALAEQSDPRAAVFAEPDWELHELSTGHWPMFTLPAELAELLGQIAGAGDSAKRASARAGASG
jgi:pimeloyl-ACP methyl ester carboxylesterase